MISPEDGYVTVFDLLRKHHNWFRNSIPLIASENVTSPSVKEAIVSDFGSRYAEGWPGERVYAGCRYIDEVEKVCIELAKELFRVEFADVRPISGVVANLAIYTAFTEPGDVMMALSIPNGGHISMGRKKFAGTAGFVHGLKVEYLPFDNKEMNIDIDETMKKVRSMAEKPKLVMFGASMILFPQPVKELADFFKSYGTHINYDAAHVAGLIAGGKFQDPLREGADTMTMSTHKTLFGPQGGMIVSSGKYADSVKRAVFPGLTSNHHLHHMAGKTVALAEMLKFGMKYADQVIRNAKALAEALYNEGFKVLGESKGFTESHQVVLDVTKHGDGFEVEKLLESANIITNRELIPEDVEVKRSYMRPGGLRLGVAEVTRLGMEENQMAEIARLFRRLIIDREEVEAVKKDVATLRSRFQKIHYAFDTERDAYEYIRIR